MIQDLVACLKMKNCKMKKDKNRRKKLLTIQLSQMFKNYQANNTRNNN